ncbi:MAG: hypothetical protein LBJ02_11460 [Bifidobacteriaceae bacterium]|jgi:hypothetical protein|nr:hypothetical protein [Bifidobacteriaceae bacterium]
MTKLSYYERYLLKKDELVFTAADMVEALVRLGRGQALPLEVVPQDRLEHELDADRERNAAFVTMDDAQFLLAHTSLETLECALNARDELPEGRTPKGHVPTMEEMEVGHDVGTRVSVLLNCSKDNPDIITSGTRMGWVGTNLVDAIRQVYGMTAEDDEIDPTDRWGAEYLGALVYLGMI